MLTLALLAFLAPSAGAASLVYLGASAFDPVSLSVIGPLPLSVQVVHPSGARAYGPTAHERESIAVLDTLSNTVIATVPTGMSLVGMTLDPGGGRLYVSGTTSTPTRPSVSRATLLVIDTTTNTVVARLDLGVMGTLSRPVMHPAGTAVYLFRTFDAVVVDTATSTVAATIPLPEEGGPYGVADPIVHPLGHFIYVPGVRSQVVVVDTRLNAVVRTIGLPSGFFLGAILPAGPEDARLFAFSGPSLVPPFLNTALVFDAATGARIATIGLGAQANTAVADPEGGAVYAALYKCLPPRCGDFMLRPTATGVAVIDGAALGLVATLPAGQGDLDQSVLSFDPDDRLVYVLGRTRLSVIDAQTRSLAAAVPFVAAAGPFVSEFLPQFVFGPGRPAAAPGPLVFYRLGSAEGAVAEQWGAPGDRPVPADYDGDGRADVAVWRPRQGAAEGLWFVRRSSDGAPAAQQWGAAATGDLPVPADYDGDGRADLAVWRGIEQVEPEFIDGEQGIWYIVRSSDGQALRQQWGAVGDVPVPADYDGDGRADLAVRRGSEAASTAIAVWYIVSSRDGSTRAEFLGGPTDVPVPADYDGDGRADLAVWRPATGEWWIVGSRDGVVTRRQWGAPGDVPVPADYDGDGRVDLAVWRPTSGEWWIIGSRDGVVTLRQWGAPGDVPGPADYDGDGVSDLTVFRP